MPPFSLIQRYMFTPRYIPFPVRQVPFGRLALASMVLLSLAACGGKDLDAADAGGATSTAAAQKDHVREVFQDGTGNIPEPNAGIDFSAEHQQAPGTIPVATEGHRAAARVGKALPAAPRAAVDGVWGAQAKWPFIPIHAVVLPDGRVMTYGSLSNGQQGGKFFYDVWDPAQGLGDEAHMTLPNTTQVDIFCSAQVVLPLTGDLFIAGGDVFSDARGRSTNRPNSDTTLFRPGSNSIEKGEQMKLPRWYATATTLPDGSVYIQGGLGGEQHPEIRHNDGHTELLEGIASQDLFHYYPRNWVAPDGGVFGFSATQMYRLNVQGKGARRDVGELAYKSHWEGSAVMFQPGRILLTEASGPRAAIIDIRQDRPLVTDAGRMSNTRMWHNSTVLADGSVAITGGAEFFDFKKATARNPVYQVDLWNPKTGEWHQGPSQKRMRLYHSTAILLPDASLFTGGGGAAGPESNLNAEIYYPPYLYNRDGSPASRPVISAAPATVNPGGNLTLTTPDAGSIQRVTLVATGSVTHSFNMNQRFLELTFSREGNRLVAKLPDNAYETPPGYYMVFVLNQAGTPSQARIVRVNVAQQASATDDVRQVYRYAADGERFLYSVNPDLGGAWKRQGVAFAAHATQRAGMVPVYRYQAITDGKARYLYSTQASLKENGWTRIGIAFYAYAGAGEGRVAVHEYRQYHGGTYTYYTTGAAPGAGWYLSGDSFYVPALASAQTAAVKDTQAPSVPRNLVAQVQPNGAIQLSWEKSVDAGGAGLAGYRLRRGPIVLSQSLLQTERFTDTGARATGHYTYSVEAVDRAGNTSARAVFRAQVR